jgi:AraC-like DNA-binding protein
MNHKEREHEAKKERETQREQYNRQELRERMARAISEDGVAQPLPGLHLTRFSTTSDTIYGATEPSFCVIAQGSKEVCLGENCYQYDPYNYLLATLEMPVVGRVLEASQKEPYLGLRLSLDPTLVGSVMMEMGGLSPGSQGDVKAITVSALDTALLDATVRLARLLDSPVQARLLLPLITKEIIYWLLVGEQGDRLRHMTIPGGHTHRIGQAVDKICRDFNQPLYIKEIARGVGMSVSGFHHHFKTVTAMSPLQFQKQLRLQEARRLMLGEELDVAAAGYRVGYDDTAHFSREYKRFFGAPPLRDLERLRKSAEVNTGV